MGIKKKTIEPKPEIKKADDKASADRKPRKAERKTQRAAWSDAGIKHAVTPLG